MQKIVWVHEAPAARHPARKKRRSAATEGSLRTGTDPLRCYLLPRDPPACSIYAVLQQRRATPVLGLAAIKFFLDNGADPNESPDEHGLPANLLWTAAKWPGNIDAIRLLASYGADPCRAAVLTSTIDLQVTLALLEIGANPNQSNGGGTAITQSARFCGHASRSAHHLDILELLLRFGGDANFEDGDGYTPMMAFVEGAFIQSEWREVQELAPQAKWTRVADILLSAGASLDGLTSEEIYFLRPLCLKKLP